MNSPTRLACFVYLGIYIFGMVVFVGLWADISLRKALQHWRLQRASRRYPCSRCCYFTGEILLKCAVNPVAVMTDEALNCRDFIENEDIADLT
jgi:hypothetical protein